MLGKKDYQEKLYTNFQLSQRIPKDNFYRRLKGILDLDFLYKMVEPYYGREGQKSIDPIVFFKLMLVNYLENIIYDRKLMEFVGMRLDILYFLNYDISNNPSGFVNLIEVCTEKLKEGMPNVFFVLRTQAGIVNF
jgi:transposase